MYHEFLINYVRKVILKTIQFKSIRVTARVKLKKDNGKGMPKNHDNQLVI